MKAETLILNAQLRGGADLANLAISGEKVVFIGAEPPQAGRVIDAAGRLMLPALVDPHVHLDKTFMNLKNESGTLLEAIDVWKRHKALLTFENYVTRALDAVRQAVLNGVGTMRTHVDVDAQGDLRALEALLSVREHVRDVLNLQVVALGNAGVNGAETEAMRRALELGADLVGGAPALTDDPEGCINAAFELAEAFDKDIDLHIDETEDPWVTTLIYLSEQTTRRGFEGRVTAGHCCSLAFVDDERAKRIVAKVAEARLNVVTLPSCNLVLLGRGESPAPRGLTRVKELLAAGVNVAAASDNVQDPFNPFGHYDPLYTASLCAQAAHMTSPAEILECLDAVSVNAARLTGRPTSVEVGGRADLVLLDTNSERDAVTRLPRRLATFHDGRLVVEQRHEEVWPGGNPWT